MDIRIPVYMLKYIVTFYEKVIVLWKRNGRLISLVEKDIAPSLGFPRNGSSFGVI